MGGTSALTISCRHGQFSFIKWILSAWRVQRLNYREICAYPCTIPIFTYLPKYQTPKIMYAVIAICHITGSFYIVDAVLSHVGRK